MTTSIDLIVKKFLQNSKKGKVNSINFKGNIIRLGKCFMAEKYNNLLLLNETIDMSSINELKELLIENAEQYGYSIIYIPLNIGEEELPTMDEIKKRLENRLNYWLLNTQELANDKIREQYKAYYEQFNKLLYETSSDSITGELKRIYDLLNDNEFIKRLKFQVARRKSNIK